MRTRALFLSAAVFIHLVIFLFGGLLFTKPPEEESGTEIAEVDLVAESPEDEEKEEEKKAEQETAEEPTEEAMEAASEAPPDMAELLSVQPDASAAVPELEALSLSALEGALGGGAAAGEFGWQVGLTSGGRIGGTGTAAQLESEMSTDTVFELADLEQKPRALFQVPPRYPSELLRKKTGGTVYVLFVVDQEGRVINPKIESSPDPAFDTPVIEALKRWRFEPGSRNGQKVQTKMRLPIRFSAAG